MSGTCARVPEVTVTHPSVFVATSLCRHGCANLFAGGNAVVDDRVDWRHSLGRPDTHIQRVCKPTVVGSIPIRGSTG